MLSLCKTSVLLQRRRRRPPRRATLAKCDHQSGVLVLRIRAESCFVQQTPLSRTSSKLFLFFFELQYDIHFYVTYTFALFFAGISLATSPADSSATRRKRGGRVRFKFTAAHRGRTFHLISSRWRSRRSASTCHATLLRAPPSFFSFENVHSF